MSPQLSILIVNWRSKDYVRNCLKTVRSTCAMLSPEIVVVDGGSFDGCGEMIKREFPEVKFVQSNENLGFGRSNNLGFEQVTSENLLLLNPDTELKENAIERLLKELKNHPDAGIVAPKLLNTDGSLQTSCVQSLPTPLNQALDSNLLRRLFPRSNLWGTWAAFRATKVVNVEAVSGACMLLRSEVFRRVAGFSSQFFMYAEDMDLCAKIRKMGLKVYYVPNAEVIHHGGGSSRSQVSEFSTIMMRMAGETYMRLNHGTATAVLYRALQATSAALRLTLLLCAFPLLIFFLRSSLASTIKKWWFVFTWAIGKKEYAVG